jgi:hypothetical protein
MREAYNQWMAKHGGSIVNMAADMWGGMPGMGHSGAARSGVDNLTKTASVEWGRQAFGLIVSRQVGLFLLVWITTVVTLPNLLFQVWQVMFR